tara:strand:+ start:327 stop:554 length:228 start_codon:yes stop_codon:yes gene_type:complete
LTLFHPENNFFRLKETLRCLLIKNLLKSAGASFLAGGLGRAIDDDRFELWGWGDQGSYISEGVNGIMAKGLSKTI